MIPVNLGEAKHVLSEATRLFLKQRTTRVKALDPKKIDADWKTFRKTKAGREVIGVLRRTFRDKCAYCEQVAAKDIEHFYPKSRFPAKAYTYANFLWACKNCNTEKMAVFPLDSAGKAILLNPTADEPLDYIRWDELSGKIIPHPDPIRGRRATQTRDLLKLDQYSLFEERRIKLNAVLYLLSRVVEEEPVRAETIERLQEELAPERPWLGIIRQLFCRPTLTYKPLVDAALAKSDALRELTRAWEQKSAGPR